MARIKIENYKDRVSISNGKIKLELDKSKGYYEKVVSCFKSNGSSSAVVSSLPKQEYSSGVIYPQLTEINVEESKDAVVVLLSGNDKRARFTEKITMYPEQNYIHVTNSTLFSVVSKAESIESRYVFEPGKVDFSWAPYLRPMPDHIIGQHSFRSPAIILQQDTIMSAIVPDLETYPDESKKNRLGLHINILGKKPVMGFGFIPHKEEGLLYFRRKGIDNLFEKDNIFSFSYYIIVNGTSKPRRGYQEISKFLWDHFGKKGLQLMREQVIGFEDYLNYTHKYVNDVLWTELGESEGVPLGGIPMGIKFSNDIWFQFLFNQLYTAYGFYYLGKLTNRPDLIDKAKKIKNLLLTSPQKNGLFSTIFSFDIITGYRKTRWIPSSPWLPGRITYGTYVDRPDEDEKYYLPDCSWAAYWLLQWYGSIENEQRLLDFTSRYADALLDYQMPSGAFPSFIDAQTLRPHLRLLETAGSSASALFLAEMYKITNKKEYLQAAERTAHFVKEHIIPIHRWQDFEYANDSLAKPPELYDRFSGQYPQTTMPMFWTADLFLTLSEIHETSEAKEEMDIAVSILDYLCLYQAVWSPPFLSMAVYGGFVVGNGHPAWSDARQGFFPQLFARFYKKTGRIEYLERAVAATRAALPLAFIPENAPISPIWKEGPAGHADENYGHRGQDGRAVAHSIDFGIGYGLVSYGLLAQEYGDLFINLKYKHAVGIDGVSVLKMALNGTTIDLSLNVLKRNKPLKVKIEGCNPGTDYKLAINQSYMNFVAQKDTHYLDITVE
ncbi:MAG: hypothetical protein GX091_04540 [Peptococcaceae bacterium]|nr:hypothetical protein [Peptococcaceae bacterium]